MHGEALPTSARADTAIIFQVPRLVSAGDTPPRRRDNPAPARYPSASRNARRASSIASSAASRPAQPITSECLSVSRSL